MLPLLLTAAGAGLSALSAAGKAKRASSALDEQRTFALGQKNKFNTGFQDIINSAKAAKTYEGDISKFKAAESAADLEKRMASGASRMPWEQAQRNQAALTSANTLAAATRGARSGSDLMTVALAAQQGENIAQENIGSRVGQQIFDWQGKAQQDYMQSLGQTAAADARERGLMFQSDYTKQQNIQGLTQQKLMGGMELEQNLFAQEQAQANAIADARAAMTSGIAGIASGLGTGLMGMQQQANQMNMLKLIYNKGGLSKDATSSLGLGILGGNFLGNSTYTG